jgi:GT2 family glycosyltransferase
MPPLVSVIVLNYNGREFVEKCLRSLAMTYYPRLQIIVVDNGSTDSSRHWLTESFSSIFPDSPASKLILNPINVGFGAGNNLGLQHAEGKYITFLSIDTEVDPKWITELVGVMEKNPDVGISQGKLLLIGDKGRIDSVGGSLSPSGFGRVIGHREVDEKQYDKIREIFTVSGAAFMVRRSLLQEIGSFDPALFMYYEDTDLCIRARLRRYRILCVPTSIVYHARGGIANKELSDTRRLYHYTRNRLAITFKNYKLPNCLRYVLLSSLVRLPYTVLRATATRDNSELSGVLSFGLDLRKFTKERRKIQENRALGDSELFEQMARLQ